MTSEDSSSSSAILTSTGRRASLSLENGMLSIRAASECSLVPLQDIIGCDLQHERNQLVLVIQYWPLRKSFLRQRLQRKKHAVRLKFTCGDNLQMAEKWLTDIRLHTTGPSFQRARDIDGADRLLIFVNPFSGTGTAMKTFLTICSPILKSANIRFELARTEYSGHTRDMVESLDLSRYIGIVLMSGDGLVYEVLNGLVERSDFKEAIKTPIGFLPGGSGNGLCSSVCYENQEPLSGCLATTACLLLCKHCVMSCDLLAVETKADKASLVSMLSFNWGLIADIDIESEKYRTIGSLRFTLGTVMRLAGLRRYKATISYLPGDLGLLYSRRGVPDQYPEMPTFDEPLPSEWKTFETNEFVLLLALNHSHLSSDLKGPFPNLRYDDGLIHLMVVTGDITRARLTKNLMALEDGNKVCDPCIHLLSVTAFRLVPEEGSPEGINVLDGELISPGPVQAHVMPSMARIMTDSRIKPSTAS